MLCAASSAARAIEGVVTERPRLAHRGMDKYVMTDLGHYIQDTTYSVYASGAVGGSGSASVIRKP